MSKGIYYEKLDESNLYEEENWGYLIWGYCERNNTFKRLGWITDLKGKVCFQTRSVNTTPSLTISTMTKIMKLAYELEEIENGFIEGTALARRGRPPGS